MVEGICCCGVDLLWRPRNYTFWRVAGRTDLSGNGAISTTLFPRNRSVRAAANAFLANWSRSVGGANGNYAEIFEKYIGKNTPLGLARGQNALYNKGGILYAPPVR